jgi:hypothetical protein
MKERPILFSESMVRALLEGRKTQTRRVIGLPPAPNNLGAWEATTVGGKGVYLDKAMTKPAPEQAAIWHTRTGKCICCTYGKPGDQLWVRETWASPETNALPGRVAYNADGQCGAFIGDGGGGLVWLQHGRILEADGYQQCFPEHGATYGLKKYGGRWRPSTHMPRWASRITLEITKVRVERVQDISEADAKAEGCEPKVVTQQDIDDLQITDVSPFLKELAKAFGPGQFTAKDDYARLWDSINAKRDSGIHAWKNNPWVWVIEYKRAEAAQ